MTAIERFYSLCSSIPDDGLRLAMQTWATKHIRTYKVTSHVDRVAENSSALKWEQERSLRQMIYGVVEESVKTKREVWMQGTHRLGTLIHQEISIVTEET